MLMWALTSSAAQRWWARFGRSEGSSASWLGTFRVPAWRQPSPRLLARVPVSDRDGRQVMQLPDAGTQLSEATDG